MSVLDIGSSNLYSATPAGVLRFLESFGVGDDRPVQREAYCAFGWKVRLDLLEHVEKVGHRHRFAFSRPIQSWIMEEETPELLVSEFERVWEGIGRARVATAGFAQSPQV